MEEREWFEQFSAKIQKVSDNIQAKKSNKKPANKLAFKSTPVGLQYWYDFKQNYL